MISGAKYSKQPAAIIFVIFNEILYIEMRKMTHTGKVTELTLDWN